MTESKTYNGWTNYETWNVALWIDNEQGSYNDSRERARACLEAHDNDKDKAAGQLADELKEEFEEGNPLAGQASCFSDLLGAALSAVNWHEIAENYVEEVYEEAETEEAE